MLLRCYVLLSLIVFATCANSTQLSCKVDYLGKIHFFIEVPMELRYDIHNISFYYWTFGGGSEEEDCFYDDGDTFYRCKMHKLTEANDSYYTYTFSMIIFSNSGTQHSITEFTLPTNIHQTISPWRTRPKAGHGSFIDCDDSFGTKLLAVNGPHRNISVEWVQYPLSVRYGVERRATKLIINSTDIDYSTTRYLEESACKKDMCSYFITNLHSCANYKICIQTQFFKANFQIKCRIINSYCPEVGLEWKDTLLMVFAGIIILGIFGLLLYGRRREGLHVSERDEKIVPRSGNVSPDYVLPNYVNSTTNLYVYPEARIVYTADVREDEI